MTEQRPFCWRLIVGLCTAWIVLAPTGSSAAPYTMDFTGSPLISVMPGGSVAIGDYEFTANTTGLNVLTVPGDCRSPDLCNPTGMPYLTFIDDITLARLDSHAFSLVSIDLGRYLNWNGGQPLIEVTGHRAGGGALTAFGQVLDDTFLTLVLDWTDLSSVVITSTNRGLAAMDNLVFEAASVPEPASLALLALGLAGLGGVRRLRNARA